jgi:gas vesicle protein
MEEQTLEYWKKRAQDLEKQLKDLRRESEQTYQQLMEDIMELEERLEQKG